MRRAGFAQTCRRAAARLGLLLLTFSTLALGAREAWSKPPLEVEALQLLGPGTPAVDGWFTVAVRLRSLASTRLDGRVELVAEAPYSDAAPQITRAPFSLSAREQVVLELPTHGYYNAPPALSLRVVDASGDPWLEQDIADPIATGPFLLDLNVPSRLVPALRARTVPIVPQPGSSRSMSGEFPALAVSSPRPNPETGQLLLPETALGYAPATLVTVSSAALTRLPAAELDALTHWVLAGGALAISVSRPEDLRSPVLLALLGGEAKPQLVPNTLREGRLFLVPTDPAVPTDPSSPTPPSNLESQQLAPSAEVVNLASYYTGGNLHPSAWGAFASYGLGEVHLLAFDPSRDPFVSDPWVQLSLVDLVRHAWEREQHLALPLGRQSLHLHTADTIRRELDPNERTRWTIAVSALLLLAYAVLAGPLNFFWAARRGKPLRALVFLPLYALLTMSTIMVVGRLGRGLEGRSRRLSFIEAGAGMPQASIVRYRGFYTSDSEDLVVRASDRRSVLGITGTLGDTGGELAVDRDGMRIEALTARPWQTVVVREDGFLALGGGVSIVPRGGRQVSIVNRTAHDLVSVVLKVPDEDAVFFPRIKHGASVALAAGTALPSTVGSRLPPGAPAALNAGLFAQEIDAHAPGLSRLWGTLESVAQPGTDFWPEHVPVLFAELENGEPKLTDAGLTVDSQRVLIRVVGYGGVL